MTKRVALCLAYNGAYILNPLLELTAIVGMLVTHPGLHDAIRDYCAYIIPDFPAYYAVMIISPRLSPSYMAY